jgi:acyl-CoA thioester hydrolase
MGFVYYGNYATYFEVARVETLRACNVTYKSLEDAGILLPVIDFHIRYFAPAHYDDQIEITTTISELPTAKLRFHYQTYRGETLLNEAETDLVFVDAATSKPMRCPQEILTKLSEFFDRS